MLQMNSFQHYYSGMEIDDIRAFVAVATAGSVSAAARDLFVTQPAVTRRVQRLEDSLGVPLLDRHRRPFTLTAAGHEALGRCRELLVSLQELRSVTREGREPGGEIRIGVAHALSELTLEGPVGEVQRRFPRVLFRLGTGWSRELLERVRIQALDAAFLLLFDDESPPPGIHGLAIADERMVVVAPRSRPSVGGRVGNLGATSWVLNPEGCAARARLRRSLLGSGLDLRVAVETYDYELQLSLVAKGRGLGLVPARLLARSRFRESVRPLRVRGFEFGMKVWAVRGRPSVSLEPVLDDLTRVVEQRLSKFHVGPARARPAAHASRSFAARTRSCALSSRVVGFTKERRLTRSRES